MFFQKDNFFFFSLASKYEIQLEFMEEISFINLKFIRNHLGKIQMLIVRLNIFKCCIGLKFVILRSKRKKYWYLLIIVFPRTLLSSFIYFYSTQTCISRCLHRDIPTDTPSSYAKRFLTELPCSRGMVTIIFL